MTLGKIDALFLTWIFFLSYLLKLPHLDELFGLPVHGEDCEEIPQGEVWQHDPLVPSTALPLSGIPGEVTVLPLKPPSPLLRSSTNCPILDGKENGGRIHPSSDTLQNLCSNMTKI